MRKLNGITINGEFLGSGVVVNGMFRAICAISPVIMREFVLIVNKIDALDEAVKISNFNCDNDNNRMDIEFENRKSKGVACLYFKLYNGEPELTDCKLVLDDKEYSTIDENINISPPNNDMSNEEEKKKKLQALKESKLAKLKNEAQRSSPQQKQTIPKPKQEKADNRPLSKKEQKMQELLERKRKALGEKSAHSSSPSSPPGEADSAISESCNDIELKGNNSAVSKVSSGTSIGAENMVSNSSGYDSDGNVIANDVKNAGDTAEENENYSAEENASSPKLSLDDFTEEELENLSLEELEQLERELSGEESDETSYNDNYTYDRGNDIMSSSNIDFAEKISHGIAEGITQGLTQGLVQGLSEGLSQGLSQGLRGYSNAGNGFSDNGSHGFGNNFGENDWNNAAAGSNENFNFSSDNSMSNVPDYSANGGYNVNSVSSPSDFKTDLQDINDKKHNEALKAKYSYSYDENSNVEELSDYYSDFYDNLPAGNSEVVSSPSEESPAGGDSAADELERLKAELAAFEEESLKNKMSLEEYMARQKEIEEAKEKIRRRKIRIVGSRGRVNAKAIEDGIYVSGSKVYKWGDTRHLEG